MADSLNIAQQSYARWESGKHTPTLLTLEKVSSFFKIPIAQLIDEPVSLDYLFSTDKVTYQGKPLSPEQLEQLKKRVTESITN